jgi:hypothetical protein
METAPGVPVAMTTNLYEVSQTLDGMAKPLQQTAAYSQRDKVYGAVGGERWGEGDVEWNLDPIVTPYLLGAALGTISDVTISGAVTQHTISQNQSSVPQTLSIYRYRGVDTQLFSYAAIDTFELAFSVDKFATGKASMKSFFPVDSVSGTITRNATTLFTWGGANLQFGTTPTAAIGNAPNPVTDFTYSVKNNAEVIFESGTINSTRIGLKDFELSGDYTEYFESVTDRNNYYNTISEAAVLTFFGANLGVYREEIQLLMPELYLDTFSVETGLDNFFIEKAKYVGESATAGYTTSAVVTNNSANP